MNRITFAGVAACLIAIGVLCRRGQAQSQAGSDGTEFSARHSDTVKWVDYPGDGAQFGIKEAFIYGDPTKPGSM